MTSTCVYVFKSGKKKDLPCSKPAQGLFCEKHKQLAGAFTAPPHQPTPTVNPIQISLNTQTLPETLDSLYIKLLTLEMSSENKSVIEKRFRYTSTLNPNSSEFHKNVSWLKNALNFPYTKAIPLPVTCRAESVYIDYNTDISQRRRADENVIQYINDVYKKLDSYIYGMDKVKEEILSFVCKRISNPTSHDHVLALCGSNGVGKCFAKGTLVQMFDKSSKKVEDIQVGDKVMGDDFTQRTVLALGQGTDQMYKVIHLETGEEYTVNGPHILVLRSRFGGSDQDFIEMTVDDYTLLTPSAKSTLVGITRKDPKTEVESSISIIKVGKGEYYGFTLDGNERFLLANGVVTHNTRLALGLSKALGVPFRTINLGSVNDVSYFTGHGFTYVESEPGRIVQILNETQCKNCIIYFDELDKIHQTEKGQAINGFLTHLIDPSQNKSFQDVYLSGLELDVSQVFFVFSFNDASLIDATVRDRLKVITIPDPSLEDKINIAEKFILPEVSNNVNYFVELDRSVLKHIVSSYDGRAGLRGVKRALEDVIGKLNVIRMLDPDNQKRLSYFRERYVDMIECILTESTASDNKDHMMMAMYS